ncbi:MAG TPA: BNR-4 repeat-containing protein [Thermoplasmata archaeon]|nr:BNR-4 repeat-containing protein [Thermoplasmata archaeon]
MSTSRFETSSGRTVWGRGAFGIALTLGLAFLAPALAPSASASHNTQVLRVSQGLPSLEQNPSVAFGPSGEVYVAYLRVAGPSRDILLRADSDGWASDGAPVWNTLTTVNDNAGTADGSAFSNVPIAVGPTGSIYVAWVDSRDLPTTGLDVRVARSDSQGNSFGSSIRVSNTAVANSETYPSVAVGPSGTVYVAWQDDRDGMADVFFSSSSDQGQTWSANVKVNDASGFTEQRYPRIEVDAQERVFLVWSDFNLPNNRVLFDVSTDGGASWGTDREIGTPGNNWFADLAVDEEGNLHAAFQSDRATDRGVYYTRSYDRGVTWFPDGRVNDVPMGGDPVPRVTTWSGGWVFIEWTSNAPAGELNYAIYSEDGSQFVARGGAPGLPAFRYDIAADASGNVFLTWHRDDGGGNHEVYATWLDLTPRMPDGFRAVVAGSAISLSWNPNSEQDLSGYSLWRSGPSSGQQLIATVPAGVTSYVDAGRTDGTWSYYLAANDRQGHSSPNAFAEAVVGLTTDDRLDALQSQLDALQGNLTDLMNKSLELETDLDDAGNAISELRRQLGATQNLLVVLLAIAIVLSTLSLVIGLLLRKR